VSVNRISLELGQSIWYWDINPPNLQKSFECCVQLSQDIGAWKPKLAIEGNNSFGYRDRIDLEFSRPIVATHVRPIFDARLGCSISPTDQWKIDPIRNVLSLHGFDYNTVGIEVEAGFAYGQGLLQSEKQWAQGGDCFISVLTQRDISAISGRGKPTPWIHTESGLAYDASGAKPYLAFVEQGVDAEALYRHLDSDHVIEFSPYSLANIIQENEQQLTNFRNECSAYRVSNSTQEFLKFIGGVALVGLAAVGAASMAGTHRG
jgi:hypothetical protein